MRIPTTLQPWRLLPAYVVNGVWAALGIGLIQLLVTGVIGPHVAPLVVSGAVSVSISDLPNTLSRTWHRVSAAALLSSGAALVVDSLRSHPLELGVVVGLIAFAAMMTLAWGARAGTVSFVPLLSMIFSMAVPPTGYPFEVAAWSACGSFVYVGWALLASRLLQRQYRKLALAATLQAAAQLFRSRGDFLSARRPEAGDAAPMRAWISGEAVLAERLQAARDLLFAAAGGPRWQRDVGVLLRVIDLRDVLLASRLDADLLGDDAAGRSVLDHLASALRQIGADLDAAATQVRDGTRPGAEPWSPRVDFAALFNSVPMPPGDPRARLLPSLIGRLGQVATDVGRVQRLLRGELESLPLTREQLQLFVAPEGWPLRALRPHWRRDSLVLRHAIRMGLALGCAYYLALLLPWGSHPYWLVLSVAVVLRGNLGDTLARRNARVLGTVLGCLVVVGLSYVPSTVAISLMFLAALATAHAFVTQRYWLTATAASVMALLQSHLVDPAHGFAIAERVADTFLGALLAWSFSYVLPSWERRSGPDAIRRVLRDLQAYAAHSLKGLPEAPVDERMARRQAYDSLAALGAALHRSRVEPKGVQLPAAPIATLLDHGERLMAHLSIARLTLARLNNAEATRPRVDAALAEATAALSARLDLKSPEGDAAAADSADAESLPEQPALHDVVPWLVRRLNLMVVEATRIRGAAKNGLAG